MEDHPKIVAEAFAKGPDQEIEIILVINIKKVDLRTQMTEEVIKIITKIWTRLLW